MVNLNSILELVVLRNTVLKSTYDDYTRIWRLLTTPGLNSSGVFLFKSRFSKFFSLLKFNKNQNDIDVMLNIIYNTRRNLLWGEGLWGIH